MSHKPTMDLLDENWDLPLTKDISRDLFTSYAEDEQFDVDKFLLENNFQYVPLDTLSKELHMLTRQMDQALLDETRNSYDDYMKLCENCSEDKNTMRELQLVKQDLSKFVAELKSLTEGSIATTKEVINDTLEYLKGLDEISYLLHEHSSLHVLLTLSEELCQGLQSLCQEEELESTLCCDLIRQLHLLTQQIYATLTSLHRLGSPLVNQLRNECLGILQQFRVCLSTLSDKCYENPGYYPEVSQLLIAILKSEQSHNIHS